MLGGFPDEAGAALRDLTLAMLGHDILSCQVFRCLACRDIIKREDAVKPFGVALHEITAMEEEFGQLSDEQRQQWIGLLVDGQDDEPETESSIPATAELAS